MADLEIPDGFGLWNLELTHATIAHKAIVTLGFEEEVIYTDADNTNALAAFAAALGPLHDTEVTYSRLVTLVGVGGQLARFESTGTTTGLRTAQTIYPPNVSYLIRKPTPLAGRRYRGRMYIPFVASNDGSQTGQLTGGALTLLSTAAAALRTNLVTTPAYALSLRLLHATSPLSATPPPTTIPALVASGVVATQRRRLERT
jgi:hypothetical protein